ncbi:MAG: IS630 family transposase [Alphaproteobacteria bacterium]|nr:IS630 family transposase [Alphaproteobacteria bacterium]
MEKIDARSLSTDAQQQLRYQAIRLREDCRTYDEIALVVGVHPSTISGWWQAYQKQGIAGIEIKKRGRRVGQGRRLDAKQEDQLRRLLIDKTPDQMKLPFALWTRRAVQDLVHRRWSIELPIRTVRDYLKRFGFTPQKPLKRAYEQNQKAVQRWLDGEYPAIAKRAKKKGAEIHWGDETGLRNDSQHGRSYALRGKTPAISLSAKRQRINLICSITNQGKVRFMTYQEKMHADILIRFMMRLIKDADQKIFLMLDNMRVHHSKKVKAWLTDHQDQIEVFYLPSYSPEINPHECLNCVLKAGIHSGPPTRANSDLKRKTIAHLKRVQKLPGRVKSYFQHSKIAYAA